MIHGIRQAYEPMKTKYKYYLQLIKPFTVISAFVAVFLLSLYAKLPLYVGLTLSTAMALGQAFGQAVNQIEDIEIDRINKPYRPLPSGKLTEKEAWRFSLFLFILSEALVIYSLYYFSFVTLLNLLAFFYSVEPIRAKKYIWSVLWMALSRGALPAFIVLGWNPIVLVVFTWVLTFQITKDFGDEIGDKKYGVKTIPNTLGKYSYVYMYLLLVMYSVLILYFHLFNLLPTIWIGLAIPLLTRYRSITDNTYAWNLYYVGLFTIFILLLLR